MALAKASRVVESIEFCLLSDLGGNASTFFSFNIMLDDGFSYIACIVMMYVTSIPNLVAFVFTINDYCILSNAPCLL